MEKDIQNNLKKTRVDYLRISVTDRCNLRCSYCMPKEGIKLYPHEEVLSLEEIIRLVRIFASLGIRKIRFTGGEPLVRKGIIGLIKQVNEIDGIEEICITTNGVLLCDTAQSLKTAGVKRINISLDSLRRDRFKYITGGDYFPQVQEGIIKAKDIGFDSIKLNMVVMRGINVDEIVDFVKFARDNEIVVRLIEFIKNTPLWGSKHFISIEEIIKHCAEVFQLDKMNKEYSYNYCLL